jgi:hypothetical protein
MTFKDFVNQPNKKQGIIDPDGNIRYGEIFSPNCIYFKRMNLDGSLKPSYWKMSIPNFYYLDEKIKDKLKTWAQNMPEFEDEMIHINNIPRSKIRDLE